MDPKLSTDVAVRLSEDCPVGPRAPDSSSELASLRLAVERLTETNQRLNRRCQVAEKAVQTKCADFDKRSTKGLRNFYYQRTKELEAALLVCQQDLAHTSADRTAARADRDRFQQERNALVEYAQHKDGCDAWPEWTGHFTQATRRGKCTHAG